MTSVNQLFDFLKGIIPLNDTAILWVIAVSVPAIIIFLVMSVNAIIQVYFENKVSALLGAGHRKSLVLRRLRQQL